ncbi:hypothetical protein JCM6882_008327 [Rhodosporidiobolus microsporus]
MPLPRKSRKPPRKPKINAARHDHKPLLSLPKEIQLQESYFYLDDFEEGRRSGGVRAWEMAHENVMRRFYSTAPLVSVKRPHEHQDQLDEIGFTSRERGRRAVSGTALHMSLLLGSDSFEEKYLTPFESMDVKEREEVVLKAVADEVRRWDASFTETTLKEWRRKLVPEMRLDELCADGGLRRLIERLVDHFDRFGLDDIPPFPHPDFDRKFGLDTPAHLPLSKASRAFQEEHVLVRHSTLFAFLEALLSTIIGDPLASRATVGNFVEELTSENAPNLLPDGAATSRAQKKRELATTEGVCSCCLRSAKDSGLEDLKKCASCLKVGRIELYCSADCQKRHWPKHKTTCGAKASEAFSVPFFNTESSAASALRKFVVSGLDSNPDEYWVVKLDKSESKIGRRRALYTIGFADVRDPERTKRVRSAMRSTAYKALRESDPVSIDVLACSLVPYTLTKDYGDADVDKPDAERMDGNGGLSKARCGALVRQQFKEMFDLDDKKLDEAIKRGEKELKKDDRTAELELWKRKCDEARLYHFKTLNRTADNLYGKDSAMTELARMVSATLLGFKLPGEPA